MKKFLIRVASFSLIVVAALAIMEAAVRSVDNPYRAKERWLEKNAAKVNTLILGNSHSFYGLRADLWPDTAFNLASVSQTTGLDHLLLDRWIGSMPELHTVVTEVSVASLFDEELTEGSDVNRAVNYEAYMNLDILPWYSPSNFELANMKVFTAKLKNLFGLGQPALVCDSLGNGEAYTLENRWRTPEESAEVFAAAHNGGRPKRLGPNMAHLEAMADTCAARGVRLVIYTQPAWPGYRERIKPELIAAMRAALKRFSAEKGVEWFDFYEDSSFDEDDFYDADHLTRTPGAEKMTRLLLSAMRGDKAPRQ